MKRFFWQIRAVKTNNREACVVGQVLNSYAIIIILEVVKTAHIGRKMSALSMLLLNHVHKNVRKSHWWLGEYFADSVLGPKNGRKLFEKYP